MGNGVFSFRKLYPRLSDGDLSTGILVRHAPNQSHPGFLGVDYLSGAIFVSTWDRKQQGGFWSTGNMRVIGIIDIMCMYQCLYTVYVNIYLYIYEHLYVYVFIYICTLEVKDYEHDGPQFWMMNIAYLKNNLWWKPTLLNGLWTSGV